MSFTHVRSILGDDFISPEDVTACFGLSYTEEQIAELERTLPARGALERGKERGYMLFVGPPCEKSIFHIRDMDHGHLFGGEGRWHSMRNEGFVRAEKVGCRWYMVQKDVVPDSQSASWNSQLSLLQDGETPPTAVELVWGMVCYMKVRGVHLLRDSFVRTSSIYWNGLRVMVGCSFGVGIFIADVIDTRSRRDCGIVAARTLEPSVQSRS